MTQTYDIGIDSDGVLHNFGASFKQYCLDQQILNEDQCSPITEYTFYRKWGLTDSEFKQICHDGVDAGVIFMHGEPFPGARSAMRRLKRGGHRLHIITDRFFGTNGGSEDLTKRWLMRYDIPYDTLTFSADKTCRRTDFFIDDKESNYDDLDAAGCRVYLYDRPWNQDPGDGRRRVYSFIEFVQLIEAENNDNEVWLVPHRPSQGLLGVHR
jgi:uncharacterized HAD superfamily protein